MKITFLAPPDSLSGGLKVIAIYAHQLLRRGHDVHIVSAARPQPGLRELMSALRHGRLQQRLALARPQQGHLSCCGVPMTTLEVARPICAADVPDGDIVVATWWETAAWADGLPATKGARIHLIQGYETWADPSREAEVKAALRLPNTKVAISDALGEELIRELGALNLSVIPNGIDLQQFTAEPRRRNQPPRIGFVYSRAAMKGADRYRRIIEKVRESIPALEVLAFGAEDEDVAHPLPDGTQYVLRPDQSAIGELYRQCDLWLFATRVDSFGLPMLEAMACRTPVVGVPVGAAAELLSGGAGRLVTPPDEAALAPMMAAAAIDLLRGPEDAWARMAARAQSRAAQYDWRISTDRLETIMSELAPQTVETDA